MLIAMTTVAPVIRFGARLLLFGSAGVAFLAYPLLRPWGDAVPETAAEAFASAGWLAGHLAAAVGFVLVGFGLWALDLRRAATVWSVGASLTLLYYGAETFALNALGGLVTDPAQLAALAEAIRMGPVQVTVFGAGLVLLAVAAVMAAVRLRAVAVPFALGMVLFLPQFFATPELRIAHGVLLAAGCWLLAVRR